MLMRAASHPKAPPSLSLLLSIHDIGTLAITPIQYREAGDGPRDEVQLGYMKNWISQLNYVHCIIRGLHFCTCTCMYTHKILIGWHSVNWNRLPCNFSVELLHIKI